MHFAEKLDRFISNAGNTFSRSEAKKFKPEVNALGFFICVTPHTEPTAWDPSAIEPTLPYPHIARLSRAFFSRFACASQKRRTVHFEMRL